MQDDGTFKIFEAPGSGTGYYQGTFLNEPGGLNPAGVVTGPYVDANYVWQVESVYRILADSV